MVQGRLIYFSLLFSVKANPKLFYFLQIEGVDEDSARLVIKLALSGQAVTLSQFGVKIVDKDEYRRYSKDLSKLFNFVHFILNNHKS